MGDKFIIKFDPLTGNDSFPISSLDSSSRFCFLGAVAKSAFTLVDDAKAAEAFEVERLPIGAIGS